MSDSLIVRSTFAFDIEQANASPQTLLAQSPDIIPYGLQTLKPEDITSDDSYGKYYSRGFQYDDTFNNNVYVRAKADNPNIKLLTAKVALRTIPNEIILWPDLWSKVDTAGVIDLKSDKDREIVAGGPFSFKLDTKQNADNRHPALIARVYSKDDDTPYPDAKNWRELVKGLGVDKSTALYNATHVNPKTATSWPITLKTRLYIKEDAKDTQDLSIHVEGVKITAKNAPNASFVITDKANKEVFKIEPQPIPAEGDAMEFENNFPKNFDGFITLKLERVASAEELPDLSFVTLSVVAYDGGGQERIGAETIIFDYNAHNYPPPPLQTNFYFRGDIGDNEKFPRTKIPTKSPDIQQWGLSPAKLSDMGSEPQDELKTKYDNDVSDYNKIAWYTDNTAGNTGATDYVYLRGFFQKKGSGNWRIFVVPTDKLNDPSKFTTDPKVYQALKGQGGKPEDVDIRAVSSDGENTIVVSQAFQIFGFKEAETADYSLVAEFQDTSDGKIQTWPHEAFKPGTDVYDQWILRQPGYTIRKLINPFAKDPNPAPVGKLDPFTIDGKKDNYDQYTQFTLRLKLTDVPVPCSVSMDVIVTGGAFTKNKDRTLKLDKTRINDKSMALGIRFSDVSPDTPFTFNVNTKWYSEAAGQTPPGKDALKVELNYMRTTLPKAPQAPAPVPGPQPENLAPQNFHVNLMAANGQVGGDYQPIKRGLNLAKRPSPPKKLAPLAPLGVRPAGFE